MNFAGSGVAASSAFDIDEKMRPYYPLLEVGPAESTPIESAGSDVPQSESTARVSEQPSALYRYLTLNLPSHQAEQGLAQTASIAESQEAQVRKDLHRLTDRHPLFTDRVMHLVSILWSIVLSQALQAGLQVAGYVDVEEDSEEQTSQVVLRIYVEASAVQTLAFWDGLDNDLGRWLDHLPPSSRDIVMRKIGLRLQWSH